MGEDVRWLIGIGVTLSLASISVLVGAFWRLVGMIRSVERAADKDVKELHSRINRVREESVQKADLDGQIGRLTEELRVIRSDQQKQASDMSARMDEQARAVTARLDAIVAAIAAR